MNNNEEEKLQTELGRLGGLGCGKWEENKSR